MKLIKRLREDFPDILFESGKDNLWLPDERKIIFCSGDDIGLLHELGHALCNHFEFSQDIELIHAERDAWDKAIELGERYEINIDKKRVESALDWYRDWLHNRSLCPKCSQNGVQDQDNLDYFCINCDTKWQANDARKTGLKRYKKHP